MTHFYSVLGRPIGERSAVKRICLYICSGHISRTTHPHFTKFSVHVTYSCGSVLLWRRCYATSCVLPVLWITPSLHTIAMNRRCKKSVYSKWLTRGQNRTGAECDIFDCVTIKSKINSGLLQGSDISANWLLVMVVYRIVNIATLYYRVSVIVYRKLWQSEERLNSTPPVRDTFLWLTQRLPHIYVGLSFVRSPHSRSCQPVTSLT